MTQFQIRGLDPGFTKFPRNYYEDVTLGSDQMRGSADWTKIKAIFEKGSIKIFITDIGVRILAKDGVYCCYHGGITSQDVYVEIGHRFRWDIHARGLDQQPLHFEVEITRVQSRVI